MKILFALLTSAVLLSAQQDTINAGDRLSVSVGRARPLSETTAGKHNLVVISGRRMKPDCTEGKAILLRRDLAKTNPTLYQSLNTDYQNLIASDSCGFEFYHAENMNLVVNAGLNWLADIMSNTSTPSVNTQCNFLAVTPTAISPGATDTTLSGEIVTNGFNSTGVIGAGVRAQATYTHSSNATTYTLTKTYTAAASQTIAGAAVLTASSVGTMCFEDAVTSATLALNDTLAITWTITI